MSTAAPVSGLPSSLPGATPSTDHLPDDPVLLKRMILELLATLSATRHDNDELRQRLDRLLRRLYGPKNERFDPNQPFLFNEVVDPSTNAPAAGLSATPEPESSPRRARPHGRQRLPERLPREPVHYTLPEAERLCPCCGHQRIDIGVDKSEQLDYRPASIFVTEHIVHKYLCPQCSGKAKPDVVVTTAESTINVATTTTAEATAQAMTPEPVVSAASEQSTDTVLPEASTESEPKTAPAASTVSAPDLDAATAPSVAAATGTATVPVDPSTIEPAPRSTAIITAPRPAVLLPKCLAGPGLLAHIVVSKYADHVPLHRQEHILARHGVDLTRSTMCDWMAACAHALTPLYDLMVEHIVQSRVLHTDDTPVKLLLHSVDVTALGRIWVYLGDRQHPYNVFDFTPNRKRDGPQAFLRNYRGYLQADAFAGYDILYLPDPIDGQTFIVEVACNAHARRKFHDARGSDDLRACQALAYYSQLFELERRAKDMDESQRLRLRQDLAVPILDKFKTWLDEQKSQVLPKSPMAEAIGYALNNWTALVRYTEAGYLAIDNNWAEREMKKIALGRKNWLFFGTKNGGRTAAVLLTFTSTCQRLGVEPWAYLQDVLTRLPLTPPSRLASLLPDHWQAARQAGPATALANATPTP